MEEIDAAINMRKWFQKYGSIKKAMIVTDRTLKIWDKSRESKSYYCLLCGKGFLRGDKYFLLINNYLFFPNCNVHVKCWDGDTDKRLTEEWKKVQAFVNRYRYWIKRI